MDLFVVFYYEADNNDFDNRPDAIIGVYNSHKKAIDAVLNDAKDFIASMAEDGYEYHMNNDDDCFEFLITEEKNLNDNICGLKCRYDIMYGEINKNFEYGEFR
jgi:hypothetical protein